MPDRAAAAPAETAAIREAVSIHTRKIFDSCRDKDCVDDLRVFPTVSSQTYIDNALSIRPRSAELLYIAVSVEPISFNRGYYTVDCTHFYLDHDRTLVQRPRALDRVLVCSSRHLAARHAGDEEGLRHDVMLVVEGNPHIPEQTDGVVAQAQPQLPTELRPGIWYGIIANDVETESLVL